MMHTEQLALWRSEFGRDYTDRNDHEKPERVTSGRRLLGDSVPARVLVLLHALAVFNIHNDITHAR
jgi:hypothetical protein